jgi:hypothetical protein
MYLCCVWPKERELKILQITVRVHSKSDVLLWLDGGSTVGALCRARFGSAPVAGGYCARVPKTVKEEA